jgi:hypothetical protein
VSPHSPSLQTPGYLVVKCCPAAAALSGTGLHGMGTKKSLELDRLGFTAAQLSPCIDVGDVAAELTEPPHLRLVKLDSVPFILHTYTWLCLWLGFPVIHVVAVHVQAARFPCPASETCKLSCELDYELVQIDSVLCY